jgi:hypothetical protein
VILKVLETQEIDEKVGMMLLQAMRKVGLELINVQNLYFVIRTYKNRVKEF